MSEFFIMGSGVIPPGAPVNTLSAEGGPATPPSANNFNFSGTFAGGYGSNGAIVFSTVNPGKMNAQVQVDNSTIFINAANQLQATPIITGTATTTGNTLPLGIQNINSTIPVPNNSAISIIANLVAYDAINGNALGGEVISCVKNVGGALTVVASTDDTRNNDMALSAWGVAIVTVGSNAFIQVTGVAGTTLDWKAIIEVVGVS